MVAMQLLAANNDACATMRGPESWLHDERHGRTKIAEAHIRRLWCILLAVARHAHANRLGVETWPEVECEIMDEVVLPSDMIGARAEAESPRRLAIGAPFGQRCIDEHGTSESACSHFFFLSPFTPAKAISLATIVVGGGTLGAGACEAARYGARAKNASSLAQKW